MHLSFSCSTEPEDSDDNDGDDEVLTPWRRGSTSGSTGVLAGRMSSELKARLDTPVVTPRTMGILSAGSKSSGSTTSTPTGHRIVVSNLQTSVTHEDIRVNCPVPAAQIVITVFELEDFVSREGKDLLMISITCLLGSVLHSWTEVFPSVKQFAGYVMHVRVWCYCSFHFTNYILDSF